MSDLIERLRYLVSHDALLSKPRIPQHVWKALLDGADALEQQAGEIATLSLRLQHSRNDCRDAGNLIVELKAENAALTIERDLNVRQCTAYQNQNAELRNALLSCARKAEALKVDCGVNPESWQAVRNGQYQNISTTAHIALGTIRGPALDAAMEGKNE